MKMSGQMLLIWESEHLKHVFNQCGTLYSPNACSCFNSSKSNVSAADDEYVEVSWCLTGSVLVFDGFSQQGKLGNFGLQLKKNKLVLLYWYWKIHITSTGTGYMNCTGTGNYNLEVCKGPWM